jgi:hypothetical protein
MLSKLQAHILGFCRSVELSLAIVKGDRGWQPVYFLAEYDYRPPEDFFRTLFCTSEFRIISGRVQVMQWQGIVEQVRKGGELTVTLEGGETLLIVLAGWNALAPVFVTGSESRQAWNRSWPHIRIDFQGGANEIKSGLWEVIQNAVVTYRVPYPTVSEAVSDILRISEDRLAFKTSQAVHGSLLIPLFVSFESAAYVRKEQSVALAAVVSYYSKLNSESLQVSARVGTRDETVERLPRTALLKGTAREHGQALCKSEWQADVETPANSIRRTTFYLVYEAIQDSPLLVDELHLMSVSDLASKSEIERLMTERTDTTERDHLLMIEKRLFDEKGKNFEEGVFRLLCRMGFDVVWEGRNYPFDILAASPNGCLVVECTWDTPSVAMTQELMNQARSYRTAENPLVLPVLATNRVSWNDLDKDLLSMERRGEVYFMTRDRLMNALEKLKVESASRTTAYLGLFKC